MDVPTGDIAAAARTESENGNHRAAKDALAEAFSSGMRDASNSMNKQRLQEIELEFGVPVKKLKEWLHNMKRRKEKRVRRRKVTPYNVFMSQYFSEHGSMNEDTTKKGKLMKRANRKWRKVRADPQKKKKLAENAIKIQEGSSNEMTDSQKASQVKKLTGKIQDMCNQLKECGYESLFLIANPGSRNCGGSTTGQKVGVKYEEEFQLAVTKGVSCEASEREERDVLRQRVTQMFNDRYQEVMKKPRVSYKNFGSKFRVEGLPGGLSFKKPSSYGRDNLQEILKSDFKFVELHTERTNEVPVNMEVASTSAVTARSSDDVNMELPLQVASTSAVTAKSSDDVNMELPLEVASTSAVTERNSDNVNMELPLEDEEASNSIAEAALVSMANGREVGEKRRRKTKPSKRVLQLQLRRITQK